MIDYLTLKNSYIGAIQMGLELGFPDPKQGNELLHKFCENCVDNSNYSEKAFDAVQKNIGYPKWTVAFLREVLDFYCIPNHLSKQLSALSDYRFPRMDELCKTIQGST